MSKSRLKWSTFKGKIERENFYGQILWDRDDDEAQIGSFVIDECPLHSNKP